MLSNHEHCHCALLPAIKIEPVDLPRIECAIVGVGVFVCIRCVDVWFVYILCVYVCFVHMHVCIYVDVCSVHMYVCIYVYVSVWLVWFGVFVLNVGINCVCASMT